MPDDTTESETTTDDDVRWIYLGSVLSTVLIVSYVTLVSLDAFEYVTLQSVPQPWFIAYTMAFLTAVGWVFGKELLKKWRG